jgi:hypothetical protein
MALADKSNGDPVFKFARAVKAFELSVDRRYKKWPHTSILGEKVHQLARALSRHFPGITRLT